MFHIKLKELRTKKGLTQKQLAKKINVSPSAISMYECDERSPDDEMIIKLSKFFDVSTDELLLDDADLHYNPKRSYHVAPPVLDDNAMDLLVELSQREEMRMLFSVTAKATKEDILKAVKIIEALKEKEE